MTDTAMLVEKIKRSGLHKQFIAERMGISRASLWNKVSGKTAFNQYEIAAICDVLGIKDHAEMEAIFFAD